MAQKEKVGTITTDDLIKWMLKYPYSSNTHYEEIFKITGQPVDYESATQYFYKAKIHRYMEYTDEELKEVIRPEDLGYTKKRKE